MTVQYMTLDDVKAVRAKLAKTLIANDDYFGSIEPLYEDRLDSAVGRQTAGLGDDLKYTSVEAIGATLFFGIAHNHAFDNGNKRTALVTLLVFLQRNKVVLVGTEEDELYDLVTRLVNHELVEDQGPSRSDLEVEYVRAWIEQRTRPITLGDKKMEFRDLRAHLEEIGCTFHPAKGNFIKVRRGGRSFTMGYPREKFVVDAHIIKDLRRALVLDEVHGTDSAAFYDLEASVGEFVNQYRNLMRRLAD